MKLRYAALVLPLIVGSSLAFAATSSAYTSSNQPMMQHHAKMMQHHSMISIEHALKLVDKAGYKNICKIELEHNYYKVKGYDAKGNKVKLKVDAISGVITQSKSMF